MSEFGWLMSEFGWLMLVLIVIASIPVTAIIATQVSKDPIEECMAQARLTTEDENKRIELFKLCIEKVKE
jgi:hypothetical protein